MINLNESHIFTRVVQTGSFTSAADALGMTVSTVSRKVADLEARLGVTLLLRTTRKINLTQVGSQYYQQCSIHLQAINDAEEEVSRLQTEAEGTLRIAVPVSLTSGTFINFLSDFAKKNILIKIEVISSNQYSDLVSDGIDVAIRIGHLSDSGLIARKLGMTSRNIVASPKYLKIKGTPKQPQDLEQHNCLIFRSKTNQSIWEFNKGRSNKRIKVNGQFVSNELNTLKELAINANGIAFLPEMYSKDAINKGSLKRVLQDWRYADTPVNAVYSSRKFIPAKLKLFLNELQKRSDLPWS